MAWNVICNTVLKDQNGTTFMQDQIISESDPMCILGRNGRDCQRAHPNQYNKSKTHVRDCVRGCRNGNKFPYLHLPMCDDYESRHPPPPSTTAQDWPPISLRPIHAWQLKHMCLQPSAMKRVTKP
ncbi:hypothetical protein E2C01_074648 [Portunus trituberculatus]|uniref:Uncharacterized protein n=1 Tax=Portunus trituberculatus TaxID=210409 RepID=A0A5B7I3U2_PORTR|nr:hypothetical protein [Portunus trituberculatus]